MRAGSLTEERQLHDDAVLEQLFGHAPELLARYRAFRDSLADETLLSPRLQELCRLRIAAIHGCDAEWQRRNAGVDLSAEELGSVAAQLDALDD